MMATRKPLDDATVLAIRRAKTTLAEEAKLRGRSRELIRQIRSGLIYKHLLPAGFVPGTISCLRCVHWGDGGCALCLPEALEIGPQFARECAAYGEVGR
jgi:hypothetical protein